MADPTRGQRNSLRYIPSLASIDKPPLVDVACGGRFCNDGRKVSFLDCKVGRELLIQEGIDMLSVRNMGSGFCLRTAIGHDSSIVKLKSLFMEDIIEDIEYLFCMSSSPSMLRRVETVELSRLHGLRDLFGWDTDNGVPPLTPDVLTFSNLKNFQISDCETIKKLFHLDLLSNLQQLEVISVSSSWAKPGSAYIFFNIYAFY